MSAAHQTLRMQWFENNGLRARGSPNVTYRMFWGRMAHQTLQIHEFVYPWLTKRYVYIGLRTHGSANLTNMIVFHAFLVLYVFLVFHAFSVFMVFNVFQIFSVFIIQVFH